MLYCPGPGGRCVRYIFAWNSPVWSGPAGFGLFCAFLHPLREESGLTGGRFGSRLHSGGLPLRGGGSQQKILPLRDDASPRKGVLSRTAAGPQRGISFRDNAGLSGRRKRGPLLPQQPQTAGKRLGPAGRGPRAGEPLLHLRRRDGGQDRLCQSAAGKALRRQCGRGMALRRHSRRAAFSLRGQSPVPFARTGGLGAGEGCGKADVLVDGLIKALIEVSVLDLLNIAAPLNGDGSPGALRLGWKAGGRSLLRGGGRRFSPPCGRARSPWSAGGGALFPVCLGRPGRGRRRRRRSRSGGRHRHRSRNRSRCRCGRTLRRGLYRRRC